MLVAWFRTLNFERGFEAMRTDLFVVHFDSVETASSLHIAEVEKGGDLPQPEVRVRGRADDVLMRWCAHSFALAYQQQLTSKL
jgi:hypothetical protein